MHRSKLGLILAASLAASCASTPRPFVAEIEPAPADDASYARAFQSCADQVAIGRRDNFTAPLEPGHVAGATAIVAGEAIVATGLAGASWEGLATVASGYGVIALTPVAMAGVSATVRARRERDIQTAMSLCLAQNGYHVASWRRLSREEAATATLTTPTAPFIAQPSEASAPQQ